MSTSVLILGPGDELICTICDQIVQTVVARDHAKNHAHDGRKSVLPYKLNAHPGTIHCAYICDRCPYQTLSKGARGKHTHPTRMALILTKNKSKKNTWREIRFGERAHIDMNDDRDELASQASSQADRNRTQNAPPPHRANPILHDLAVIGNQSVPLKKSLIFAYLRHLQRACRKNVLVLNSWQTNPAELRAAADARGFPIYLIVPVRQDHHWHAGVACCHPDTCLITFLDPNPRDHSTEAVAAHALVRRSFAWTPDTQLRIHNPTDLPREPTLPDSGVYLVAFVSCFLQSPERAEENIWTNRRSDFVWNAGFVAVYRQRMARFWFSEHAGTVQEDVDRSLDELFQLRGDTFALLCHSADRQSRTNILVAATQQLARRLGIPRAAPRLPVRETAPLVQHVSPPPHERRPREPTPPLDHPGPLAHPELPRIRPDPVPLADRVEQRNNVPAIPDAIDDDDNGNNGDDNDDDVDDVDIVEQRQLVQKRAAPTDGHVPQRTKRRRMDPALMPGVGHEHELHPVSNDAPKANRREINRNWDRLFHPEKQGRRRARGKAKQPVDPT